MTTEAPPSPPRIGEGGAALCRHPFGWSVGHMLDKCRTLAEARHMTTTRRRTRCPYCDQEVAVTTTGLLYQHGGVGSQACVGTGRQVDEPEQPEQATGPRGIWFNGTYYPMKEG